jgi:hypothetical protein
MVLFWGNELHYLRFFAKRRRNVVGTLSCYGNETAVCPMHWRTFSFKFALPIRLLFVPIVFLTFLVRVQMQRTSLSNCKRGALAKTLPRDRTSMKQRKRAHDP